MTLEEMNEALEKEKANTAALTEAAAASVKQISDLTAERDSLKEELTATKEAYEKNIGTYGRFTAEDGAVKYIDPRKE